MLAGLELLAQKFLVEFADTRFVERVGEPHADRNCPARDDPPVHVALNVAHDLLFGGLSCGSRFGTTTATARSPQRSSGTAMTAASLTPGHSRRMSSSWSDEIHSPPDLITSLIRSVISKYSCGSRVPMSPVCM